MALKKYFAGAIFFFLASHIVAMENDRQRNFELNSITDVVKNINPRLRRITKGQLGLSPRLPIIWVPFLLSMSNSTLKEGALFFLATANADFSWRLDSTNSGFCIKGLAIIVYVYYGLLLFYQ